MTWYGDAVFSKSLEIHLGVHIKSEISNSDIVRTPVSENRTVAEKNAQKSLFFRIIKGVRYEISAWAANTR